MINSNIRTAENEAEERASSMNINDSFAQVYQNEFGINTASTTDDSSVNQTKIDTAINYLKSHDRLQSIIAKTEVPTAVISLFMNNERCRKFLQVVANDLKPNLLEYGREFLSTYHNKHDVSQAMDKVLRGIFVDATSSFVVNCVKYITPDWLLFINQAFGIIFPTFWELFIDYIYPPSGSDPDPLYWGNIIYLLIMALLHFILMFLLNQFYIYGILTSTMLRRALSMAIVCFIAWLKRKKPVK
ncbi:unnamed protein product [Adineta ricciae]|uniref:Uncharacterized protein n=1 Tax=Adineta ricciae TaxID=249248 RepID=A0A816F1A5_ADIRI|nr:unnamed protein product [Adineta ricciae]